MAVFGSGMSVCVVSEDEEFREQLVAHLLANKWAAAWMTDRKEIQEYLDARHIDMVILDNPDDELWNQCAQARKNSGESQQPQLYVLALAADVERFKDLAPDVIKTKPVTLTDVEDGLVEWDNLPARE